jgi:Rad3-related DNA helicase
MMENDIDKLIIDEFPFKEPMNGQFDIIKTIIESYLSGNKYFILEAATGTGKSVIGYTVSRVMFRLQEIASSTILTKTKSLQEQYSSSIKLNDRKIIHSIKSAKNYLCNVDPSSSTYYAGPGCIKNKCPKIKICQYVLHKKLYDASIPGITNYNYYIENKTIAKEFLICDEAHNVEDILCTYSTLELDREFLLDLYRFMDLELGFGVNNTLKYFDQLKQSVDILPVVLTNLYNDLLQVNNVLSPYLEEDMENSLSKSMESRIRKFSEEISSYLSKIRIVTNNLDNTWVKSVEGSILRYKPVFANLLLSALTKDNNKFVLFMSASIGDPHEYARTLGIKNYGHLSLPSVFPIENRQVHLVQLPGMNSSNKDEVLPVYLNVVNKLMDKFPNDRGIIHCVSFELGEAIYKACNRGNRIYLHRRGETLDVEDFVSRGSNKIIVSPSSTEGIDLPDELSRFQIVFKLPFPYLGDPWIRAKMDLIPGWYERVTMNALLQACGRSIRHANDYAHTFIIDGSMMRFTNSSNLPQYFRDAIKVL